MTTARFAVRPPASRRLVFGEFVDAHGVVGLSLNVARDLGFGEPLHENFDAFIGQFQHPHDDADRADGMNILRCGILDVQGFLRRQEDHSIAG